MAEIVLGKVFLTEKQLMRLQEAHSEGIRGFSYKEGVLAVNHSKDLLTDQEKSEILSDVSNIPDDLTDSQKNLKALEEKQSLTLDELIQLLRAKNII